VSSASEVARGVNVLNKAEAAGCLLKLVQPHDHAPHWAHPKANVRDSHISSVKCGVVGPTGRRKRERGSLVEQLVDLLLGGEEGQVSDIQRRRLTVFCCVTKEI
jgi:hypothetical protein